MADRGAAVCELTRELWLKSEYRHEWLRSVSGNDYDADVILFTLRAQR